MDQLTWEGLQSDVRAGAAALGSERNVVALFTIGCCLGGRLSFLCATMPDLAAAGVIGFYGWPVGERKDGMPAPADVASRMQSPVLGIFGGADGGISAADVARFEGTLESAKVDHKVVTYPGAGHSFFDRKQAEFAEASSAAWGEVMQFVKAHTPAA